MKARDIAEKYKISERLFENWLRKSDYKYKEGLTTINLDDRYDVAEVVKAFKAHEAQKERKKIKDYNKTKEERAELSKILITSGFSFEGYKITKYSGYISGDDALQVDRGFASFSGQSVNVGEALMDSLKIIRRNALIELKEAALDLGCNAVIGVDFDYITLEPEAMSLSLASVGEKKLLPYVFGVTANGNAVIIEKEE